jgi:hypothetical protein
VQAEDCSWHGVLQDPFLDHHLGPASLPPRRSLLGRLENELHGAGKVRLYAGQDFRHPHENGHMIVMAAGVHHPDFLPVELGAHRGLEWQVDQLGDRQRVHVGSQRHDRAGLAPTEHAHHSRMSHAGPDIEAEAGQVVRDQLGGSHLSIRELRMLVNVAPPRDHAREHGLDARVDLSRQGVLGRQDGRECEDGEDSEDGCLRVPASLHHMVPFKEHE